MLISGVEQGDSQLVGIEESAFPFGIREDGRCASGESRR